MLQPERTRRDAVAVLQVGNLSVRRTPVMVVDKGTRRVVHAYASAESPKEKVGLFGRLKLGAGTEARIVTADSIHDFAIEREIAAEEKPSRIDRPRQPTIRHIGHDRERLVARIPELHSASDHNRLIMPPELAAYAHEEVRREIDVI